MTKFQDQNRSFQTVVIEIDFRLNLKFRHGNFWEFDLKFKFRCDLQYLKLKFSQIGISVTEPSEIKMSEFEIQSF